MTAEPRYRCVGGAQEEELPSGETVVVHPATGLAVVLNEMGAVVWSLLDGRGAGEVAAFICAELPGAAPERVERDVAALARQLLAAGLVEELPACEPSRS